MNSPRIETVSFWCRYCWKKGSFDFTWEELQNKTLDELRRMCEYRHAKTCKNADVRLRNATKTR